MGLRLLCRPLIPSAHKQLSNPPHLATAVADALRRRHAELPPRSQYDMARQTKVQAAGANPSAYPAAMELYTCYTRETAIPHADRYPKIRGYRNSRCLSPRL